MWLATRLRRNRALLSWKLLAIVLILTTFASLAFATRTGAFSTFRNPLIPGVANEASGKVKLTLTLDRRNYSYGQNAEVTVTIQNTGNLDVTIDNPEQAQMLIVYEKGMNEVGTWTRFYKALPMNAPLGPQMLHTGQSYAWTFEWNLSVRTATNSTELSIGTYNVQASVLANASAPDVELSNYLSNLVQLTIN
jgi:hypothetical protein